MNALAVGNRARVVESFSAMRERVYGAEGAAKSAYVPLAMNSAAAFVGAFGANMTPVSGENVRDTFVSKDETARAATVGGPITGSPGIRIGGTS